MHALLRSLTPRRIFLFDGFGALLTVVLVAGVVAPREASFGMPRGIALGLAAMACCYAAYSLACAAIDPARWRPWLRGIAVANAAYASVLLGFVATRLGELPPLGVAWFTTEAALLLAIAGFEWRSSSADEPVP